MLKQVAEDGPGGVARAKSDGDQTYSTGTHPPGTPTT